MKRKDFLQQKLKLVPKLPGVYLMQDEQGKIIYVGKAVKLQNRLQCYFGNNSTQPSLKVALMIAKIHDFQYVICQNEQEALILESNLIKRHRPFYNILLKDDHDYPYIKVSLQDSWPEVTKAYRIGKDKAKGALYFGPYMYSQLSKALKSLEQIFPLHSCNPAKIRTNVPCLNYQLGKCIGTCCNRATAADYREIIKEVCNYLRGDTQKLEEYLRAKMAAAADAEQFEQAAFWRDRLLNLQALHQTQRIVTQKAVDADVLAVCRQDFMYCLQKLEIRAGKIIGTCSFFFETEDLLYSLYGLGSEDLPANLKGPLPAKPEKPEKPADRDKTVELSADSLLIENLLEMFLAQHYADLHNLPASIILANSLPAAALAHLNAAAESLVGSHCTFTVPQRGEKYEWGKMAANNAGEALAKKMLLLGSAAANVKGALTTLMQLNGMPNLPHRIEAYDVANFGNDDLCAAMVCFIDGVYSPKNSLLFRLREQKEQNDYLAMSTVLLRRLRHLPGVQETGNSLNLQAAEQSWICVKENKSSLNIVPDLILLDGGKGHRQAVMQALEEQLQWSKLVVSRRIFIGGMVKNDKHETRALLQADGQVHELQVFLPQEAAGTSDSHKGETIKSEVNLLRFLTRIQDEVHRLANNYYHKLQKNRILHYELENIKGIGAKKRQLLLAHFKSMEKIKTATLAELQAVKGISEQDAQHIFEYFRLQA